MTTLKGMYNMGVIAHDMADQLDHEKAQTTMFKCTQNCFISLKENTLLPTEERCLRNCFIKSHEFNEFVGYELNYITRNI